MCHSSLSCKAGIITHHGDTVGLNLRLCDPWMEGASNKTSSHRIRLWKKGSAQRRSWCQGASVGSSVNPMPERVMWRICGTKHASGLRRRRPVLQQPLLPIHNNRGMNMMLLWSASQDLSCTVLLIAWPPLEEETSNVTGVKITSESPWEQWCSGSRSSPSKNHSETNGHLGIKVPPRWTATKKRQLMSQGSPDPWLCFLENFYESGKSTEGWGRVSYVHSRLLLPPEM